MPAHPHQHLQSPALSPLRVLIDAQKRVPALKYAEGVVGIAAAAALVTQFGGNSRGGLILLGLVFVGMILLFLFSVLAHAPSPGVKLAGQTLIWAVLIFFMTFLCFTASAAFNGLPCNWAGVLNMRQHSTCDGVASAPQPSPDRAAIRPLDAAKHLKTFTIASFQGKSGDPRYWTWSTDHWEEKTPSGFRMFHDIVGRISLNGCDGDKTRKQGDPNLEMFIPDKGCPSMVMAFRYNNASWEEFGPMLDGQ